MWKLNRLRMSLDRPADDEEPARRSNSRHVCLFGAWSFLGYWSLEFGVFTLPFTTARLDLTAVFVRPEYLIRLAPLAPGRKKPE
jgi:hypothetical protein